MEQFESFRSDYQKTPLTETPPTAVLHSYSTEKPATGVSTYNSTTVTKTPTNNTVNQTSYGTDQISSYMKSITDSTVDDVKKGLTDLINTSLAKLATPAQHGGHNLDSQGKKKYDFNVNLSEKPPMNGGCGDDSMWNTNTGGKPSSSRKPSSNKSTLEEETSSNDTWKTPTAGNYGGHEEYMNGGHNEDFIGGAGSNPYMVNLQLVIKKLQENPKIRDLELHQTQKTKLGAMVLADAKAQLSDPKDSIKMMENANKLMAQDKTKYENLAKDIKSQPVKPKEKKVKKNKDED